MSSAAPTVRASGAYDVYGRLFVVKRNGSTAESIVLRRPRYTMGTNSSCDVILRIPRAAPLHASLVRAEATSNDVLLTCEAENEPVVLDDNTKLRHGEEPVRLSYGREFTISVRSFRYDSPSAPHRPYPALQPGSDEPAPQHKRAGRSRDAAQADAAAQHAPPAKKAQPAATPSGGTSTSSTSISTSSTSSTSSRGGSHARVMAPKGCVLLFSRGAQATERVQALEVAEICKRYHAGYRSIRGLVDEPGSEWHGWRFMGVADASTLRVLPDKKPIVEEP